MGARGGEAERGALDLRAQATRLPAAARERSALHELLVCLLFFNGLRASEAAAAGLEDQGEHDGHRILRVRGKGETEKNLPSRSTRPPSPRSSAGCPSAGASRAPRPSRGPC
jgi:integrase